MFRTLVSSCAVLAFFLSALQPCAVVAQKKTEATYKGKAHEPIKDQYIVVLKDNVNARAESAGLAKDLESATIVDIYDAALNGFSVSNLSAERLSSLKQNPNVEEVIQVRIIYTNTIQFDTTRLLTIVITLTLVLFVFRT